MEKLAHGCWILICNARQVNKKFFHRTKSWRSEINTLKIIIFLIRGWKTNLKGFYCKILPGWWKTKGEKRKVRRFMNETFSKNISALFYQLYEEEKLKRRRKTWKIFYKGNFSTSPFFFNTRRMLKTFLLLVSIKKFRLIMWVISFTSAVDRERGF